MYKMAFCLSIVFVSLGTSASTGSLQCTASSYNFFSRESVDIDLTRISKDYYQGSTNLHHFSVQALSFTTGDGWGIRIEPGQRLCFIKSRSLLQCFGHAQTY
jgi:hypothetical protein